MPIHKEGSGWQWGNHGKVYPSREGAEKQAAAAHAHGYVGDAKATGAGTAFCTPDGLCLFLRRSNVGDHPGEWCLPGGGAEDGEKPIDTARREAVEELGDYPECEDPCTLLGSFTSDEGVEFATFYQPVGQRFDPELNEEHDEFCWAPFDFAPEPLHPGVRRALDCMGAVDCAIDEEQRLAQDSFAFDKGSVRSYDKDGRLHVSITPISKANVCGYYGHEIFGAQQVGLDPHKLYKLLRDPEELKKAAATFNNLPVLSKHVPVNVESPQKDLIIGSTGTDGEFKEPFLMNSMVFWDGEAVRDIESGRKKELSSAYHYVLDMTPGTFEGEPYDGVMRNIRGNHVALVDDGRAGPDVMVGDSQRKEIEDMATSAQRGVLSRKAERAKGALSVFLQPLLAADAKPKRIALIDAALKGVASDNWRGAKPKIVASLKPHLAQDASAKDLAAMLDSLDEPDGKGGGMIDPPKEAPVDNGVDDPKTPDEGSEDDKAKMIEDDGEEEDPIEEICEMLQQHLPPEVHAAVKGKLEGLRPTGEHGAVAPPGGAVVNKDSMAKDNPPPTSGTPKPPAKEEDTTDMVSKPAMDAAIKVALEQHGSSVRKETIAQMRATAEAQKFVQPYVGELAMAFDSAEEVYKKALDMLGVDVKDVHPSAYRKIIEVSPKPGARLHVIASDAAPASKPDDFDKLFPGADRARSV